MRIGLFGGSFNPPHQGHIHASEIALKYLGLDAIWWLVTPGNPLKPKAGLPAIETRMEMCRNLTQNPRIIISDIERELGTIRTYDTVTALQKSFPQTDFVWVSGTDIAYEFPKWYKSAELMEMLPFAFVGRPTDHGVVKRNGFKLSSTIKQRFPQAGGAPHLKKGQVFWLLSEPQLDLSSTALRKAAQGQFAKAEGKE